MKKQFLVAAMLLSTTTLLAQNDQKSSVDKEKPTAEKTDHCKEAVKETKEAANSFGHGDFGDAAEHAGRAAAAGKMCVQEKK